MTSSSAVGRKIDLRSRWSNVGMKGRQAERYFMLLYLKPLDLRAEAEPSLIQAMQRSEMPGGILTDQPQSSESSVWPLARFGEVPAVGPLCPQASRAAEAQRQTGRLLRDTRRWVDAPHTSHHSRRLGLARSDEAEQISLWFASQGRY